MPVNNALICLEEKKRRPQLRGLTTAQLRAESYLMNTQTVQKVNLGPLTFYIKNGFQLIELKGKKPITSEWQKIPGLSEEGARSLFRKGRNLGAVVPQGVLIIDVDVNKGKKGVGSLLALAESAMGILDPVEHFCKLTYSVRTGSGGYHFYFAVPDGFNARSKAMLDGGFLEGIDLLSKSRQVVIPGSTHNITGKKYESIGTSTIAPLPLTLYPSCLRPLAEEKKTQGRAPYDGQSLWGFIDARELELLLAPLYPIDYRDYNSEWFPLLCAVHHSTGGSHEAKEIFTRWSEGDLKYSDRARGAIDAKWETIRPTKEDGNLAVLTKVIFEAKNALRNLISAGATLDCRVKGEVTLSEIKENIDKINERILETELEQLGQEGGGKEHAQGSPVQDGPPWPDNENKDSLLDRIKGLELGFNKRKPGEFTSILNEASFLNMLYWAEISTLLSEKIHPKISMTSIKNEIKALAEKRGKEKEGEYKKEKADKAEKAKRLKEQTKPFKLSYAMNCGAIASYALNTLLGQEADKDRLICPPNGNFYFYEDGVWSLKEEHSLKIVCREGIAGIVGSNLEGNKTEKNFTDDSFGILKYRCLTESKEVYARETLPSCVNMKNGTLWIDQGGGISFKKHSKDDYLTTRLPYEFDPMAECPDFDKMLEQVFEPIKTKYSLEEHDELIRHFWELVGYMIQPFKDIPRILVWTGEGKNGKSTIAKFISHLVGEASWLAVDMHSFFSVSQPHNTTALENKLVVMDDDMRSNTLINDGLLKKFSQSQPFYVNPKNDKAYQITLQVTPLMITNNPLRLDDISKGMTRRLDVIEWGADLTHLEDSDLPDRVLENQMPGVLNRAIDGLCRLRARGTFEPPKCSTDFLGRFLAESNPIFGFWSGIKKTYSKGEKIGAMDVFYHYCHYMNVMKEGKTVSFRAFINALKRTGINATLEYIHDWKIDHFKE